MTTGRSSAERVNRIENENMGKRYADIVATTLREPVCTQFRVMMIALTVLKFVVNIDR
jgi:hypothetical protein